MKAEFHDDVQTLEALRAPWQALEARALEANAYLSARFVLPALRWLPATAPVWAVSVRDSASRGAELRGLGLFQPRLPRALFPVPHAQTYMSPHSYLGGLLLDAQTARTALHTMLEALSRRTHGLRLTHLPGSAATARLLQDVMSERGATWHEEAWCQRACMAPSPDWASRWRQHVPTSRLQNYERQWRKLGESGKVTWHYLRGDTVHDGTIERFMALEHAGWKGQQGTSLRSDPRHARFFQEMTRAFQDDGDLFFTELRLSDEVIASTCNLVAGREGFAFKVGFDPRHAKRSPGLLNELGFLKGLEEPVDHFRFIDSGSEPGSFIEQLWPDRVQLRSGSIALGSLAKAAARTAQAMSYLRRRLIGHRLRPSSSPA
jgi:CelD/BcsL family acetyltransferase involved in cellulose biosynthesis